MRTVDGIEVTVTGRAEAEIGKVEYAAIAKARGKTGPEARARVEPMVKGIRFAIEQMTEAGGIDTEHLKTTMDVGTYQEFDERGHGCFAGYEAKFTIRFFGTKPDAAVAVYDKLTCVVGVEVPTPIFHVANREEVDAIAFRDAVRQARRRFTDQCAALGLLPGFFEGRTWEIRDRTYQGNGMRIAQGGSFQPGNAEVTMEVAFLFVPKPLHP